MTLGGIPSNELLKATVQIFNDSLCKEIYKEYNYPVTDSMICAGYMAGKVDACLVCDYLLCSYRFVWFHNYMLHFTVLLIFVKKGDSGGGLIVKENDKYTLAGITSWGRGCGREKQPGVYTKVPGTD